MKYGFDIMKAAGIAGLPWVIAFGVFLYLLVRRTKEKKRLALLALMELILLMIPFTGKFLDQKFGDGTLAQAFSLVPLVFLLSYAVVELAWNQLNKKRLVYIYAAAAIVLVSCLGFWPSMSRFYWLKDRSVYNQMLSKAGTDTILTTVDLTENLPKGTKQVLSEEHGMGIAYEAAKSGAVLAVREDSELLNQSQLEQFGFKLVGSIREMRYYHYESDQNLWSITMNPGQSGLQSMSYIITDLKGHVYVLDGGQNEDCDYLRQRIRELGNHVDGWFLSHPHTDHVNALSTMLESGDYPEMDSYYVSDFDQEKYQAEAADWDVYSDYERIVRAMETTGEQAKVKPIYAGDVLDMDGMQVKVLHDYTTKDGGDAANDGSLMLKFYGEKSSMLFCADTGASQSKTILENYGEDLPASYIQLGHHGNGGLSEEFYKKVASKGTLKVAFFDAPDWLYYPKESDWYNTPKQIALMTSLGAKCVHFADAPYSVLVQ